MTIFAPQICRPKNGQNAILSTIFVLFEASEYTFFNMNFEVRHCDFERFASTKRRFLLLGGPAPGTPLRRPSRRPSGRKTAKMQYCHHFSCFSWRCRSHFCTSSKGFPGRAPRWPQDAPRWPQDGPTTPQDGPKTPKDDPRQL